MHGHLGVDRRDGIASSGDIKVLRTAAHVFDVFSWLLHPLSLSFSLQPLSLPQTSQANLLVNMAPFLHQILAAAFLAASVVSSPVSPHIGVPLNAASDANLGPGKVSFKQGTYLYNIARPSP